MYVLLVKPLPNNPNQTAGRREIALMPQDMKLFMQMIRSRCYARAACSLHHAQVGWKRGWGAFDPGLAAKVAIDQARRLRHPLYVIYVDLARYFPKCNREAVKAAEVLAGLPKEVFNLVALIYGSATNKAACVECQYESEAGL